MQALSLLATLVITTNKQSSAIILLIPSVETVVDMVYTLMLTRLTRRQADALR